MEQFPNLPFGVDGVNGDVFHHVGKTFVEPQVVPPAHRHEVAEPLVGQLVSNDGSNQLLHVEGGVVRVQEEIGFTVSYQAPVFHGPG